MKTNNAGGASSRITSYKGDKRFQSFGACKPPQSRVLLLPIGWNRPFIKRFKEWWTK